MTDYLHGSVGVFSHLFTYYIRQLIQKATEKNLQNKEMHIMKWLDNLGGEIFFNIKKLHEASILILLLNSFCWAPELENRERTYAKIDLLLSFIGYIIVRGFFYGLFCFQLMMGDAVQEDAKGYLVLYHPTHTKPD